SNAHYNLGNALKATGDVKGAIDAYRQAIAINPKKVEAHTSLGMALGATGDVAGAIAAFNDALGIQPEYSVALVNLAWLLATGPEPKHRDPQRAVEVARKAIAVDPRASLPWQVLGWAEYRRGAWKASIEALEKSLALLKNPQEPAPWAGFCLALAHWQLGNH